MAGTGPTAEAPVSSGRAVAGTAALVTGASSGIGAARALALAQHGARVAPVARRTDRLEGVAAAIGQGGAVALSVQADLSDPQQAVAAVELRVVQLGRRDTLVNNAAIMLLGPALGRREQRRRRRPRRLASGSGV